VASPVITQPPAFRWDRVRAGLGEWAGWALGLDDSAILWSGQRVDRPALPYLSLQRITGPNARGMSQKRLRWPCPSSVLLTCLLPAVGDAVRFEVDGWTVSHTRLVGEAVADIRDSLLEQCLPTLHLGGWSAAPTGAAGLTITPVALGEVGRVVALRNCIPDQTSTWTRRITQEVGARVRIAAHGGRGAGQSPTEWITTLRMALDDDEGRAKLARYGVAFRSRAVEVDPRDVEGVGEIEEVAALDVFPVWQGHRTIALGGPLAGALLSLDSALKIEGGIVAIDGALLTTAGLPSGL
jgi:hypothetical protein